MSQPGDLVELDTLDIRRLPRMVLKHFTARDIVCRWDMAEIYSRATASTAANLMDKLERWMTFPLGAIQVDGGSEFEAIFKEECHKRDIRLFVLPACPPELNRHVERANRTHTDEFYEVTASSFDLPELRAELLKWEQVYDNVRPHQSLGYLTPLELLQQWKQNERREVMCH